MKKTIIFALILLTACGSSPDVSYRSQGDRNAPVQIAEYSDFQCSSCRAAAQVIDKLRKEFTDDIYLTFHHFPQSEHPYAQGAAEAAECAGRQGRFWEMHDELFIHQSFLDRSHLSGYADLIGLDTAEFEQCMDSNTTLPGIQRDVKEGLRLGVEHTPTFFINGRKIASNREDPLREAIKEALDEK